MLNLCRDNLLFSSSSIYSEKALINHNFFCKISLVDGLFSFLGQWGAQQQLMEGAQQQSIEGKWESTKLQAVEGEPHFGNWWKLVKIVSKTIELVEAWWRSYEATIKMVRIGESTRGNPNINKKWRKVFYNEYIGPVLNLTNFLQSFLLLFFTVNILKQY